MTDLPSQFGFGLVTGGFALAVGDRDDPGREPDALAATGSVLFRPQASRIVIPGERVITPQQIECKLDADGYLYLPESVTPGEDGLVAEEDRGVYLVANDTTDATPQGWTYEVTVSLTGQSQWRFPIAVTTGSVQDISALVPVDSSGGTPIIQGPQGDPGPPGQDGIMASIVPGDGIEVDASDPANPVVSATGGGGGEVPDTGWRNITESLNDGWEASVVEVKRAQDRITLALSNLTRPGAGGQSPMDLPTGWAPRHTFDTMINAVNSIGAATPGLLRVNGTNGRLYIGPNSALGASFQSSIQVSFVTDAPWPTELPGTPA